MAGSYQTVRFTAISIEVEPFRYREGTTRPLSSAASIRNKLNLNSLRPSETRARRLCKVRYNRPIKSLRTFESLPEKPDRSN